MKTYNYTQVIFYYEEIIEEIIVYKWLSLYNRSHVIVHELKKNIS